MPRKLNLDDYVCRWRSMAEVLVAGFYLFQAEGELQGNSTLHYVSDAERGLLFSPHGGQVRCKANAKARFFGPIPEV